MARRWLVTGCSSGLGRALAESLARAGDLAVVTARRTASLAELAAAWPENLFPVAMDLSDAQQCEDAVKAAVERFGGIDVLVNNAGSGLFGAVEEVADEELREQLESLVVGPWRLVRLALPTMRAQGSGHIVNVSTTGARSTVPGLAAYLSGKAALEGMSLALANEVAPLGIRVTVVEPGAFATRYGTVLGETAAKLPEYAALSGMLGLLRGLDANPDVGRPEQFAEAVLAIVGAPDPLPVRIPVGPGASEIISEAVQAAGSELDSVRDLTFGASH
ncbi:MAG TPA: SDR family oxidoreductase [Actinospica sp.]|nr:SDR family oxidoreductase [Actinospica sp.]